MKKCPFCAEEIQDEAIICRFCGRSLIKKNKWGLVFSGGLFSLAILFLIAFLATKKPLSLAFFVTETQTVTPLPTSTVTLTPLPTSTSTPDPCPIIAAQLFDYEISRQLHQAGIAVQNLRSTNKSTLEDARDTLVAIKVQIEKTDHPLCANTALAKVSEQLDAAIELADAIVANAHPVTVTSLAQKVGKATDIAISAMEEFYLAAGIKTSP